MLIRHMLGVLVALTYLSPVYAGEYKPFVPLDTSQTVTEAVERVSATPNWRPLLRETAALSNPRVSESEVERRLKTGEYELITDCTKDSGCVFRAGGINAQKQVDFFPRNPLPGEVFACINGACVSSACANPGTLMRTVTSESSEATTGCIVGESSTTSGFIQTPGFHVRGFGVGPSAVTSTQTSQHANCVFKGEK